jgi:two-component system sensor histidine kinase CpxA
MTSLYLRIVLSIGLTMALVVAASVLMSFAAANRWSDALQSLDPEAIRRAAQQALDSRGRPGLEAWIRASERELPMIRLLVVDRAGRDLLDRPVPGPLVRRLKVMRPPVLRRPQPLLGQVSDAEGRVWSLVALPRRPGPFGVFGAPGLRWGILAVALVITALASLMLARNLSAPVRSLRQASQRLAEGDLAARAGHPVTRRADELGALGRDLDHMATRLQALLESRAELLRNVSHDLRTPLTRIQMASGLAAQREAFDPALLELIDAESERLDGMLGELLALARMEDRPIRREAVDLAALLTEVAGRAGVEADQHGAAIDLAVEQPLTVEGDRDLLERVFDNVVQNALKYGECSTVTIHGTVDGAAVRVTVEDRGPGVPDGELEAIFDPFHRLDRARSAGSGEGLGLAIAAKGLSIHGGTIRARNLPERGLSVEMSIPARLG